MKGRQFTKNILDLDSVARQYSFTRLPSDMPVLAFFDFAAAFPSVFHRWIFCFLRICDFPDGFVELVEGMYHMNATYVLFRSSKSFLCWVLAGVLQGCPLSGSIFAICADPVLSKMKCMLHASCAGVVRACADDIGAALSSVRGLNILKPIFDLALRTAGLKLKPSKCVIVPLHSACDEACQRSVHAWIADHIPCWSCFKIEGTAKYLGVWMGPAAATMQWKSQLAKLVDRACCVASMGLAASAAIPLCNLRAVPVVGYLAQFCSPPAQIEAIEKRLLCKILRIPYTAFPFNLRISFDSLGGPGVRSATVLCKAALMRASSGMLSDWVVWYRDLAELSVGHGTMQATLDHHFSPPWWDSAWFASAYFNASSLALPDATSISLPSPLSPLLPLPDDFSPISIPQSTFAAAILSQSYSASWQSFFTRRLQRTFGETQAFENDLFSCT